MVSIGRFRLDRPAWAVVLALGAVTACAAGRLRAAEAWPDQRVLGPFVCRADFPLAQIEGVLGDLRQLQSDLASDLKLPPANAWIEVYLFRDKATYDRYLVRHFPQVPYRRALYIKSDGRGKVLAHRGPEFEIDLRHECTHALLHAALPAVPLWLDEGLAEYYETAREQRATGGSHRSAVCWSARLGTLPRLAELEKKRELQEMGRGEYRFAWAWVHFMLHDSPELRKQLVEYLSDLRDGQAFDTLGQRIEARIPSAQERFTSHWKAWTR
ncbi:MAG: DUF1570 domain-containing protein [Thermoguttaceae bacterium]|jgi:hypothetical protein|nr:DUF1570 domain-containing protein [Thermoguttaceae bacterium]